jgi:hypothetical protein
LESGPSGKKTEKRIQAFFRQNYDSPTVRNTQPHFDCPEQPPFRPARQAGPQRSEEELDVRGPIGRRAVRFQLTGNKLVTLSAPTIGRFSLIQAGDMDWAASFMADRSR